MRNAFCLLAVLLDNVSGSSSRSFSRDYAGLVLSRAEESEPRIMSLVRYLALPHTPAAVAYFFRRSPRNLTYSAWLLLFSKFIVQNTLQTWV